MHRKVSVDRWHAGARDDRVDFVAEEVPVALTYNRHAHVVMMATPSDLEDFALGFSLSEGIVRDPSELLAVRVLERDQGLEVAMTVSSEAQERLSRQRRNLAGRTGCGLCGAESIEQAMRRPEPVSNALRLPPSAIQQAVEALDAGHPLQSRTGAVHCAGWFDLRRGLVHAREDVGRHNALDKLIGCLALAGFEKTTGFVVVSSRASYEMVYKASAVGSELLVAVSAPTALAITFAGQAGMTLVGFARPGRHNVYTFPERIMDSGETTHDV